MMKFIEIGSNIVYSDNHLLVVEKPAEMATQPDLTELAQAWIKKKYNKPGNVFLHAVHRLDKSVSGLVIFARTSKALSRLQEMMRDRKITKIYHALVEGELPAEHGRVVHHLIHGNFRAEVSKEGKESILEFQVLYHDRLENVSVGCVKATGLRDRKASCISLIQRALRSRSRESFHASRNSRFQADRGIKREKGSTLLEINLITGRYHQIRAQLSAIGCPVVGDEKYGSKRPWKKGIALHHSEVRLEHPVTKELLALKSKPKNF